MKIETKRCVYCLAPIVLKEGKWVNVAGLPCREHEPITSELIAAVRKKKP